MIKNKKPGDLGCPFCGSFNTRIEGDEHHFCNNCKCYFYDKKGENRDTRDVFFHRMVNGRLRAICLYNGVVAKKCPNNEDSICKTELFDFPRGEYHDFDGKNVYKCNCG